MSQTIKVIGCTSWIVNINRFNDTISIVPTMSGTQLMNIKAFYHFDD